LLDPLELSFVGEQADNHKVDDSFEAVILDVEYWGEHPAVVKSRLFEVNFGFNKCQFAAGTPRI
jgi:hypothetical protein